MAFEVTCSQCQGRLLVADAGVVVACPHCGTHLSIPAAPAPLIAPEPTVFAPEPAPPSAIFEAPISEAPAPQLQDDSHPQAVPQWQAAPEPAAAPVPEDEPQWQSPPAEWMAPTSETPVLTEAASPQIEAAPTVQATQVGVESAALDHSAVPDLAEAPSVPASPPDFEAATNDLAETTASNVASGLEPQSNAAEVAVPDETSPFHFGSPTEFSSSANTGHVSENQRSNEAAASDSTPADADHAPVAVTPVREAASRSGRDGVSRKLFLLAASWASAMTLTTAFLLMNPPGASKSDLESLPDVKPIKNKDGTIGTKIAKVGAMMALGHTLKLGEQQRFGNLEVTPLRVTRGPIEFVHHLDAGNTKGRPATVPSVLKLWIRFRNVSTDQTIAPLDDLVFRRHQADLDSPVQSNNFLCRLSEKKPEGHRVFSYALNENDSWNVKGQNPSFEIPPGEEVETFIPTTPDGLDQVLGTSEELVWRVHFRKGYSPKGYGVTTLIEVLFRESDVAADAPESSVPDANVKKA